MKWSVDGLYGLRPLLEVFNHFRSLVREWTGLPSRDVVDVNYYFYDEGLDLLLYNAFPF